MMLIIAYLHRVELPASNFVDADLKFILEYILKFNMFAIEIFCQEDMRIVDMICRYGEQVFQGENNTFQAVRITQKLILYSQRFVQGLGVK